ncbi:TetR/AcrR family transcriptional regulator [Ekhidna sp. To15]|uniref:TetR/AcrR family transcriptional regulator n=1 Tax=Ekhidna sp. To15 TaxID=3395267 RepID=UPI003F51B70C
MARNSEHTKQLIIDKALPIFNTKGYAAASISDITAATGITKGAIYGNFKNKDEVATAAFEKGVQIVTSEISKRVRGAKNAPDKLRAIMDFYEEYINKPPIPGGCPVLNSSIEADDSLPFLRSRVIRSIALLKGSVMKMVNRGILEGQIKRDVDVEEFTNFFYSVSEGVISLSRIEGDGRSFAFVKKFVYRQIEEISV